MKKLIFYFLFFSLMGYFKLLFAQPGSLDNSFGTGGKLTTDFGSSDDLGYSVALQTDGKIVVAGYSGSYPNDDFALVRYNTDGTLDNTFGTGGKLTTDFGSSDDLGYSVALQTDGKIIVAGRSNNGLDDFGLCRYNTNGTLDNTFGTGGKLTTDFGSSDDLGYSVALQTDGKIVVTGGSNGDFALACYNNVVTGIEETAIDELINIYPNLSTGTFTVKFTALKGNEAEIKVLNVIGETVYYKKAGITQEHELKEIDLGKITTGIYIVQVKVGEKQFYKKLMIDY